MASVSISKIVEELCNHENLIVERTQFAHALETPVGDRVQWETLFSMGAYSANSHFTKLLESWVARKRENAQMCKLKDILKNCKFIAAFESLEGLGADNAILVAPSAISSAPKQICFGVTIPTSFFVGREEEINQLSKCFLNRCPPVVVISGMGGQGKTELCREFIRTLKERCDPPGLVWLDGDTVTNLTSSIVRLSVVLQLPTTADVGPIPFDELLIKVSDKISSTSPNGWLSVIDNVDEVYEEFMQTVPVLVEHGSFVIVTTRRVDVLSSLPVNIKLDVLKLHDARNLINMFLGQNQSEEDIENLCNELGNHALVLRQAMTYILTQQNEYQSSYGIKNYLDDLTRDRTLLQNQINFIDGYGQTIFLIVTRTLKTIRDNYRKTGQTASKLMDILCLIRPDGISTQCLKKILTAAQILELELPFLEKDIHQALILLKKYSLISYDGTQFLSIHRVIQKVAQQNDVQFVKLVLNGIDISNAATEELLQIMAIWDRADVDTVKEFSICPRRIFNRMVDLSMVLEMKSFAIKNHQRLFALLGSDGREQTLKMEYCIAYALEEIGEYDAALVKYGEVLDTQKQVFGEDHSETLTTSSRIALVLYRLNRFQKSIERYERVLKSELRLFGSDYEGTRDTRHNMALVLHQAGRVDEALSHYHEVLDWQKKNLGYSHPSTLVTRNNMATILFDQGEFEEAKIEFEAVLSLGKDALGKEHSDTLNYQYWLALSLWALGEKQKAQKLIDEVLELRKKVLGPSHPYTQITQEKISAWKKIKERM